VTSPLRSAAGNSAAAIPVAAPAEVPAAGRKTVTGAPAEPRRVGYLYVLPAFAAFALFTLVPIVHAGWISFHNWDGITSPTWAGLRNYRELATDGEIRTAFGHSLELLIFYTVLPVATSLVMVGAITRVRIHGLTLVRALVFLPVTISMVVNAVAWRWIYAPDGVINKVLAVVGLGSLRRVWLGDFGTALPAVGMVGAWAMVGLSFVFLVAGAQKIPSALYDAARVDGANIVQEFFAVTLPGIRHELAVAVTIATITALRGFDLIFVLTRGGPGDSTEVPAIVLYNRAFVTGQVGSAAAIAVVLTVLIFAVVFGVTRLIEGPSR